MQLQYKNHLLRQGDVALRPIQSGFPITVGMTPKADGAVAYGEHSGHAHVATEGAEVFAIDGKLFVVTGRDGGQLQHLHLPTGRMADHQPLVLEPDTTYEVILQNEYNPFSRLMQQVRD